MAGPSAALGTVATKFMMEDQQDFIERILKNQIQWKVDDMRAAGINPILAAGGGFGGGGASAPSAPTFAAGGEGLGELFRKGGLQKSIKSKARSDAASAKEIVEINKSLKQTAKANAHTALSESSIRDDESIMKRNARDLSNAQQPNLLTGARTRRELDTTGLGPLSGSDMRKLNQIIRSFRGRDKTSAGQ